MQEPWRSGLLKGKPKVGVLCLVLAVKPFLLAAVPETVPRLPGHASVSTAVCR